MTSNKRSTPKYSNDETISIATDHKRIFDESDKLKQILERLLDDNRQLSVSIQSLDK